MQECKLIETQTFYQATERIKVDVPAEGIIYADNKDITIVPQVVRAGPNSVVAIRNAKLVTVQEGIVVGIVVPFAVPEKPNKRRQKEEGGDPGGENRPE